MYKVVDIFNGWQSTQTHKTEEQAWKELENDKEEFYNNMINRNCRYCKTVVKANTKYVWTNNKYEWV